MSELFFTADLHFGHRNIIGYCNRPFSSVEEMNEGLVAAWNATVSLGDVVWVLGDVAMGKIDESLQFVSKLNGTKVLFPGNHDRCAKFLPKAARWEGAYLAAGFDEIVHEPPCLTLGETTVQLSHFPFVGDSHDHDRFTEQRPVDEGGWLLHGHCHDSWRQRDRMLNVGVDAWAGAPVSAATLAGLISAGAVDLAPLPWPTQEEEI